MFVGVLVGVIDGTGVGTKDGTMVGINDGTMVGTIVGTVVGTMVGVVVGVLYGLMVGERVGRAELGIIVGEVGPGVIGQVGADDMVGPEVVALLVGFGVGFSVGI